MVIYIYDEGSYSDYGVSFVRSDQSEDDFRAWMRVQSYNDDASLICVVRDEDACEWTRGEPSEQKLDEISINAYGYVDSEGGVYDEPVTGKTIEHWREPGTPCDAFVNGERARRLLHPAVRAGVVRYLRGVVERENDDHAVALLAWMESQP